MFIKKATGHLKYFTWEGNTIMFIFTDHLKKILVHRISSRATVKATGKYSIQHDTSSTSNSKDYNRCTILLGSLVNLFRGEVTPVKPIAVIMAVTLWLIIHW